ncbi:MAG: preprotein translocase subunit SecG [Acidobacteria bacterium]|nr:preprotein translocase subunit SecG [Acidobacteriota bacterium]
METAVTVLHVLVCVLLLLIIMIQGGENVDISAAFGGSSQAAFGPRGAISTFAKITWVLAGIFVATSITLAIMATRHTGGSILEKSPASSAPAESAPAEPPPVQPAPAETPPPAPAPAEK